MIIYYYLFIIYILLKKKESYMEGAEFSLKCFPRNLRDVMHKHDVTSTGLAKDLSVTRMSVYNWRAGRADPTLIRLFQIASVLKTDVGHLLTKHQ